MPLSSPTLPTPSQASPGSPLPAGDVVASTRFVLMNPSHPGNVGAAARAIKVMGFSDLVLVQPRWADVLQQPDTLAMASGAGDILQRARIAGSLAQALEGITHACATAMTPRDFGPPTFAPRAHFAALAPEVVAGRQRLALVFGGERHGLSNDDVWRCHACLSIPTDPGYGSLNLAQAVQLLAYDWRQALGGFTVRPRTPQVALASADEVAGALDHWREVLERIGFLDPLVPRRLMPRLQQLLNRAQLTREELHILRGIARAAGRDRQA